MNRLQEKKLRKLIRDILITEGVLSPEMVALLQNTPGGKALSKSQASSTSKADASIKALISSLRTMRQDVFRVYGEKKGKALMKMLDSLEPVRNVFVDDDPTRVMNKNYKIKM